MGTPKMVTLILGNPTQATFPSHRLLQVPGKRIFRILGSTFGPPFYGNVNVGLAGEWGVENYNSHHEIPERYPSEP